MKLSYITTVLGLKFELCIFLFSKMQVNLACAKKIKVIYHK